LPFRLDYRELWVSVSKVEEATAKIGIWLGAIPENSPKLDKSGSTLLGLHATPHFFRGLL